MSNNGSRYPQGALTKAAAVVYDALMKLIKSGNKEVAVFVTPSGVTGIVSTEVPVEALDLMMKKLERKLKRAGITPPSSVGKVPSK